MAIKTSYTFVGIDKISNVANKVKKSFKNVSKAAGKAAKKINLANKSLEITRTVSSGLAGKIAGIGAAFLGFNAIKSVINIGADFQDTLVEIGTITDATTDQMKNMRDQIFDISKQSAMAPLTVGKAFAEVANVFDGTASELGEVTKQVTILSNATGNDLANSVNVVTSSLSQYGVGAEKTAEYVNVLAAAAKVGGSNVDESGVAIIKSAQIANRAGISYQQLNAAIQALARGGIKAEVAGTNLKAAITRLENSGIKQIKPSVVGLDSALNNLAAANLNTTQMTKLFGLEAVTVGSVLIQNRSIIKKWTGEITNTNVANEQASQRLKTFNKRMAKLGAIIQIKIIRLFMRLEPMLTKAADDFGQWIDKLDPKQIKSFADTIIILAKAMGSLAKSAGKVFSTIGNIGTSAENVFTGKGFKPAYNQLKEFITGGSLPGFNSVNSQAISNFTGATDGKQIDNNNVKYDATTGKVDVNINVSGDTDKINSIRSKINNMSGKVRTNMAGAT